MLTVEGELMLQAILTEIDQVTAEQHRLASRKAVLQELATRLRLGESAEVVRAMLAAQQASETRRVERHRMAGDGSTRDGTERRKLLTDVK